MALRIAVLDGRRHDRAAFRSGETALDAYLQKQASQHQRDGIATTHVIVDHAAPSRILGWCTLAAAQLRLDELQPDDRKRLPAYPVPGVRLARLAVSRDAQRQGIGRLLVGHAANTALGLRATLGIRVLLVNAKDARAAAFYRAMGFQETAEEALTLYLPLGKP